MDWLHNLDHIATAREAAPFDEDGEPLRVILVDFGMSAACPACSSLVTGWRAISSTDLAAKMNVKVSSIKRERF
jgi:hypothetical protein